MRGINHHDDWGWANAPRFGSTPSGNTTTTQTSNPWAGEQPYLSNIYSTAAGYSQTPGPQYFPTDTYAPLTSGQQGLMSGLINFADTGGPASTAADANIAQTLSPGYTAQTQGTFDQGTGVLGNELSSSYLNPANSPTYQTAVSNAIAGAVPQAASSFVNGNRSDSGLASNAVASAAANAAGGLAQNQYQANQQIQNNAASQAANNLLTQQSNQAKDTLTAPMVDQGITGQLGSALSTSGMTQQDQQNQINANAAQWNYNQMLPYNQLGMYESEITGAGNPGGTTSTTQPYFSNPVANISSAASGLGSLGMLAFSMFSDRDLKEDIHRIGESDSGFPLYRFRYKGEGPMSMHIGVMAQDVEKERPHAVIHTPIGRMVNYLEALAV